MEFLKIFKLDYFHQFLSYLTDWKCKKHLNSSNSSNLKSAARAKTFARQKITMKKIDSINFAFLMHIFWKSQFLCMRASPRALLISTLKSLIIVDAFCTLNHQNISKIDEISINSFSTSNSKSSKILKKSHPRFFISKWISYKLFNLDEFGQFLSYDHVSWCK